MGSYFCDCLEGWMGANCSIRMNSCQRRCQNGGTCQTEGGQQSCSCQPGYTGAECETEQRACRDAPCLHSGQCQEAENETFLCRCPLGFSGKWCEVNLCSPNPCPEGASCQGRGGSYACLCPEGAVCHNLQEPCLGEGCKGESSAALLPALLPPVLLLAGAVPTLVLLLLWTHRRSLRRLPGRTETPANNSLRPDAVHLIHNITHREAECRPGEAGRTAKAGLLPAGVPPSAGPPKVDISNQERAKLNRTNIAPVLARPPL
ncbi:protein jagged-1b-like [Candoia aspera]|uniref:protein jagged-1b-like n=1 Tax=Candoia aspera TaxID=51853 RepID=UPI002FD7B013